MKRIPLWTYVVVLLIAGVTAVVAIARMASQNANPTYVQVPQPEYAPQGSVVAGFPANLILGLSSTTSQSYSVQYASGTAQLTASWLSNKSLQAMLDVYRKYFAANQWAIQAQHSSGDAESDLWAENSSSSYVQIVLLAQPKGTEVTASYVTNPTP